MSIEELLIPGPALTGSSQPKSSCTWERRAIQDVAEAEAAGTVAVEALTPRTIWHRNWNDRGSTEEVRSAYIAAVAGALTLALTAVGPVRLDPRADERAYAVDDVGAWWYDDDDGDREWREGQREREKALRERQREREKALREQARERDQRIREKQRERAQWLREQQREDEHFWMEQEKEREKFVQERSTPSVPTARIDVLSM